MEQQALLSKMEIITLYQFTKDMRQHLVILLFLFLATFFVIGCSSDNSALVMELEQLKNQIKEDSIFRENWATESREIDALLNSITGFTSDAKSGLLQNDDLLTKAKSVQSLIEQANERIAQLEKEATIQKGNARKMPDLLQNLKQQKVTILEQDSLIQVLRRQVASGDEKIVQLDTKVNLQGKTIEEQQMEINNKLAELQRKEQELFNSQRELENTKKKSAEDLKKQRNSFHISAGLEQISIVELAEGMLPKKKQQILDDAWKHLCEAHKNGDYNALTEMSKLQSNKALYKFIKDKTCN